MISNRFRSASASWRNACSYHVHAPIASRLMGVEAYNQLTIERLADHIRGFRWPRWAMCLPWDFPQLPPKQPRVNTPRRRSP